MHEMSLAQDIIDAVRDAVGEERLRSVTTVNVDIGATSGVVAESLRFAFDAIVQDTALSSARLDPAIIPFIVHCHHCGRDTQNEDGFMLCSDCDSPDVAVVSGTELILKQIELDGKIPEAVPTSGM